MTTAIDYALMAGASYIDTRRPINQFPTPLNWVSFNHQSRDSGFEAISFQNGTEIVISYAGTYDKDITGDQLANAGLATGVGSAQLLQAIEYYLQVKAANPGATISLTGHSLGGGLAALVGVFFGVSAQTFDQAPFAQTAWYKALDVMVYLTSQRDASGNRLYNTLALVGELAAVFQARKHSFKVSTQKQRNCFKKHSDVRNKYEGYGHISHMKISDSRRCTSSLAPSLQRAIRKTVTQ